MADIQTDVLIIGTGPAGSSAAALLSTYGVENMAINRYRWLANTPRAHITNQRTMEVLRDLGQRSRTRPTCSPHQDLMGENVFCESLAGEEIGRMKSWGNHPLSKAEHLLSSPTMMNDLPQTFMEPLCSRPPARAAPRRGCRPSISPRTGCRWRDHHLPGPPDRQGDHHPLEIPARR
jgi:2,4-dichlorophenol 6-monooxygenase